MTVPREECGWAERVETAVETSVGSGFFAADDRLRADVVESACDGKVGSALVSVQIDDEFTTAEAMARYYADRRVIVRTVTAVLFDGYSTVGRLGWGRGGSTRGTGRPSGRRGGEFTLELEHVAARLGRDVRVQIIGRYVRDGRIVDGMSADPDAWSGASVLARGLPCVFNMDGAGNCDPVSIEVRDAGGALRDVYIFTEDSRSDAVAWTYAKVLRYLLHFYGWSNCPVGVDHVFAQTESAVSLSEEGRAAFIESDPLVYALLGRPDTLVLEATSVLESMSLISAYSGIHLTAESEAVGSGVRTSWRAWSELSGPARELRLATAARDEAGLPVYDPSAVSVIDLFDDNNVSASSVSWDARPIAQAALVAGDVKRYEVQVELWPGWLPEPELDDVEQALRSSVKTQALTDEQVAAMGESVTADAWYRKYHRNGSEFSDHWQVGRMWVLNEAGTYGASQYNRNTPFDSYAPYDFASTLPGCWMRRCRRFLPITASFGGAERVLVEVSFDGGDNWERVESAYEVSPDECGIWFSATNPMALASAGADAEANLWYALVDQSCRIRVTALVESDDRLVAEASGDSAPTLFRNAAVLYAPGRFGFLRCLDGSAKGLGAGKETGSARDDTELMDDVAASMANVGASRGVTARAVVPWLDDSYAIGDRIVGVRGRGLGFDAARTPNRRHACVIGKRYRLGPERFETELILASSNGGDADGASGS